MDGYDVASQTPYEFHGCYWHGHQCWLTAKKFASAEADPHSPQSIEFLKLMREREKRTRGEEAIPGEYAGADCGVYQRMSMVLSKRGRQAKRHGDLSQPALSRLQREEADAGPAPVTHAGGHFLWGPGSGHRHASPPPRQVQRNDTHFQERGDRAIAGGRAHAGLWQAAQHHDHALTRPDRLLQG